MTFQASHLVIADSNGITAQLIVVTQIASSTRTRNRKASVEPNLVGLGLNKIGRCRVLKDTPSVRGMLRKVHHLVRVEPVDSSRLFVNERGRLTYQSTPKSTRRVSTRATDQHPAASLTGSTERFAVETDTTYAEPRQGNEWSLREVYEQIAHGEGETTTSAIRHASAMMLSRRGDPIGNLATARAGLMSEALAGRFYDLMFSGDRSLAEVAARALVVCSSVYRDKFSLEDVNPDGDKKRSKQIRDALVDLLLKFGDRYYTLLSFSDLERREGFSQVQCHARLSRRLPVSIGSYPVELPESNELSGVLSARVLTNRGRPKVMGKPVQLSRDELGDGDLAAVNFAIDLSEMQEDDVCEFTIGFAPYVLETFTLSKQSILNDVTTARDR